MSRINKKYDIGKFDTFAEVLQITGRAGDVDQTPTLSAAVATWIMYDEGKQLYVKDDEEVSEQWTTIITRIAVTATPGTTIVRIANVDYEVKKSVQIGRRTHTKLWIYNNE